jgi:hypothetical protein
MGEDRDSYPELTVGELAEILAGLPPDLKVQHYVLRDGSYGSPARVPVRRVRVMGCQCHGLDPRRNYVRLEGMDLDYAPWPEMPADVSVFES